MASRTRVEFGFDSKLGEKSRRMIGIGGAVMNKFGEMDTRSRGQLEQRREM